MYREDEREAKYSIAKALECHKESKDADIRNSSL